MENVPSFNQLIQQSIIDNWDLDALTDYKGATLQYHDVARKIEKLHILFENSGVVKGDKIALCGRNSSQWAVAFLATLTYGAVAVPILHEFMADQIHNIVNHSDAKLLFVGDHVATQIDPMQMPHLEGIINNPDYSLMISRTDKLTYAREHLNELYGKKFPKYFRKEHVHYYIEENGEELSMINYTSGTTGFSKGVMIPYRALWSNYDFADHVLGKTIQRGDRIISILPMAHMYACTEWLLSSSLNSCMVVMSITSTAFLLPLSLPRHSPTSSRRLSLPCLWLSRRLSARKYSPRYRTTACASCSLCPLYLKKYARRYVRRLSMPLVANSMRLLLEVLLSIRK